MSTFEHHLTALHTMATPALRRTIAAMQAGQARALAEGDGEGHFTLECLLDYAAQELDRRRDSYTGEYDS